MNNIYAVIMAGGSGTRFWPQSTKVLPKQFLPLGKDPNEPLIAATARRIRPLCAPDHWLVVTAQSLAQATRQALPALPSEHLLLEPVGKNTAPCVAWATSWVLARDPNAIVCVLPADAYITNEAAFVQALSVAVQAANEGAIVTLGILPTRPETGYGYLHVGSALPFDNTFKVQAFVEKPNAVRAEEFFKGKSHLWNAGIFVFRADVMARAMVQHLPQVANAVLQHSNEEVIAAYPTLPSISIDFGVMERVDNVCVTAVDCGWSDVGSWLSAWELSPKNSQQNAIRSDAERTVLIDAHNNYVLAPPGKTVALIGLDDVVVVDTQDALLVMPKSRAQDVKRVVDELAQRKV